jgi:hypothetical protein
MPRSKIQKPAASYSVRRTQTQNEEFYIQLQNVFQGNANEHEKKTA